MINALVQIHYARRGYILNDIDDGEIQRLDFCFLSMSDKNAICSAEIGILLSLFEVLCQCHNAFYFCTHNSKFCYSAELSTPNRPFI